jgi:hypothetical protein
LAQFLHSSSDRREIIGGAGSAHGSSDSLLSSKATAIIERCPLDGCGKSDKPGGGKSSSSSWQAVSSIPRRHRSGAVFVSGI